MKEKSKKRLKTFGITTVIFIIGLIVLNALSQALAPPLPDYSIEGNQDQWKNTITDANGVMYGYRREISIQNPNTKNLSGTHGYRLRFYTPWIGDKKVLKSDYGVVKLVKAIDNPEVEGAKLLQEIPVQITGYDANTLNVFFNYSIPAKSTSTYYMYYKQDAEFEDMNLHNLMNSSVGLANMGGFNIIASEGRFSTTRNIDYGIITEWWYEERPWDNQNRFPEFPRFTIIDGEMTTQRAFDPKSKYILVTGARHARDSNWAGTGKGYIGLMKPDVNSSDFIGVELLEETDSFNEEHELRAVSDYKFHYADGTVSDRWENTYVVGREFELLGDSEFFDVDFDYIFEINNIGEVSLLIKENGFNHQKIKEVSLGKLSWSSAKFKISTAPLSKINFRHVFIGESDVFSEEKDNGVIVDVKYERNLEFAKGIAFENSYTFLLGIISLLMVGIYLLKKIIPKSYEIVLGFCAGVIIISIYLIIAYHPFRYIFGLEDGYYYVGDSDMGIGFMEEAGAVNIIFYYLIYLTFPLSLTIYGLSIYTGKNTSYKIAGENADLRKQKGILLVPLIFLGISSLIFLSPTALQYMAFYFMSIGIFVVAFKQFNSGRSSGVDTKKKEGGKSMGQKVSMLIAIFSFVYFVAKIVIEANKVLGATDPFTVLDPSIGVSISPDSLGSISDTLSGLGLPQETITIIAIIMSDYITIILIAVNVLKKSLKSEGLYAKVNAALWVMYIYFMIRIVQFPFFTLAISMLYVSGWIIGNITGDIYVTDDYSIAEKEEKTKKKEKKKKIKKQPLEDKVVPIMDPVINSSEEQSEPTNTRI